MQFGLSFARVGGANRSGKTNVGACKKAFNNSGFMTFLSLDVSTGFDYRRCCTNMRPDPASHHSLWALHRRSFFPIAFQGWRRFPTQQHVVRCGQFLSTAFEEIVKGPNNIRKADDPFAEWYPITSTRRICISLRQSNFADRPFAAQDLIPTKRWQSAGSHIFWRTPPRKNIPSCESVVEIREFG